jgi:hypothetical protein
MSTFKVDTLQSTTGGVTSLTKQVASKTWANFTGVTTTSVRDSFNVSSLTDNGTGSTTVNMTNSMSNANYTGSWFHNSSTALAASSFDNTWGGGFGDRGTSSYIVWSYGTAYPGSSVDSSRNDTVIVGDLA